MANPKYKAQREDIPGGVRVMFIPQDADSPSVGAKFYAEGDEDFDRYRDGHLYAFGEEAAQAPAPAEAQAPPEPAAKELQPKKGKK
jgi:hypothetical protein